MFSRMKRPSPFGPNIKLSFRPTIGTNGRVPKAAQPWPMESAFLHMFILTPEEGFASEEEAEAFFTKYMTPGKKPKFPKPTNPWHQAQEVAYQGWEKRSARARAKAAQSALDVSPDAVDAYLLLAHDAPSWEETFELETKALSAAERLLGPDPFTQYKDAFWGAAITRPFMRARLALGYTLWRQHNLADAIGHCKDLLRLNPGDNQGVRYILAALLLEMGENGEALRVIGKFSKDGLSHWSFNRALLQFRRQGDRPAARDLLQQALRRNPLIPAFLLGNRPIDSWEIDFVDIGEEGEAIEYTHIYKEAWRMTEGALEWLV